MINRIRSLVLVAAVVVMAGCYRYTRIESATPDAGADVRVDLTQAGAARLAPAIGQRVESIDGRSVGSSDSSLVLAVAATIGRNGFTAHWNNEHVDVPRSAIAGIRGRELDAKRTWGVSALTVVGALIVGKIFGIGLPSGLLGGGEHGTRQ